jgi:hypothetical protein
MTLPATVTISAQVMARRVADEVVLLDLASGNYFGLDAVGARAWQLLTEGKGPAEACDMLLAEYEVTRERLEDDIARLLAELRQAGLLAFG